MTPALDVMLVALFTLAWPVYSWRVEYPRMLRAIAGGDGGARARGYWRTLAEQWTLAAAALALWTIPGRPPAAIGLGLGRPWGLAAGIALAIALGVLLALQRRAIARRPELLATVRRQLGSGTSLVPHTAPEARLWVALSITAGVCEEILFRGYLIAVLAGWMRPAFGAGIATALAYVGALVLFGFAHIYLGRTGAIRAGLAGAAVAGLYALTGSLWISMLVHAAVDLHSGRLGYEALREDRPGAPQVAGGAAALEPRA
jgi:membrane protease YdiL (CAAX protease family)